MHGVQLGAGAFGETRLAVGGCGERRTHRLAVQFGRLGQLMERRPRPEDQNLDVALGGVEHLADLGIGQPAKLPQQDGGASALRERI